MPGPGSWLLLVELISGPHEPNLEWLQAWCARSFGALQRCFTMRFPWVGVELQLSSMPLTWGAWQYWLLVYLAFEFVESCSRLDCLVGSAQDDH